MSRVFRIPGIIFLLCALVLNLLASISLPYLTKLDITRTHFNEGTVQIGTASAINQVRFGIWSSCNYNTEGDRTCLKTAHSYSVTLQEQGDSDGPIKIGSSWTRGLLVHPIATAATFIAFLLALSSHLTVTLIASLVSFLAALLTLVAFAIDIALYVHVRREMKKLDVAGTNTNTGPAFWMTLVSLVLLLLAGCTVCFGRRRARMSNATVVTEKPATRPFWQRFRRNKAAY